MWNKGAANTPNGRRLRFYIFKENFIDHFSISIACRVHRMQNDTMHSGHVFYRRWNWFYRVFQSSALIHFLCVAGQVLLVLFSHTAETSNALVVREQNVSIMWSLHLHLFWCVHFFNFTFYMLVFYFNEWTEQFKHRLKSMMRAYHEVEIEVYLKTFLFLFLGALKGISLLNLSVYAIHNTQRISLLNTQHRLWSIVK